MRDSAAMYQPTDSSPFGVSLRPSARAVTCCASALLCCTLWVTGCSHHFLETGWSDPNRLQVQFYAPPGATVAITPTFWVGLRESDKPNSVITGIGGFVGWVGLGESDKPNSFPLEAATRRHQVAKYGADHRLEHTPEEFAVFNLCPDHRYHFKYVTAEGFPGVSIYGELDVRRPQTKEARKFMRHTFVPVALPSEHYSDDVQFYPVFGPSGAGLDQLELQHLRQGDLITKVYFVADLQKAAATIRAIDFHIERLRSAEIVLNTKLEFVDSRFKSYRQASLYGDPTEDPLTHHYDKTCRNKRFIRIEAERQQLENQRYSIREQIDDLRKERRIRTRLLDSMKIVNRRGALVLATPENQWDFYDAEAEIEGWQPYAGYTIGQYETGDIIIPPLGEVLLVMHVGGRHRHWDDPRREMVAFHPE